MATTVSAWAKPGAWALDSEEHEEELNKSHLQEQQEQEQGRNKFFQPSSSSSSSSQPLSDFPSLSAAAVTKTKKKKPQSISLSEFTTGKQVSYGSAKPASSAPPPTRGLTPDELSILPTGPRERSAEELERSSSRLGGGFRSYGENNGPGRTNSRYSSDDSSSKWGSNRDEPRRGGAGAGAGGFSNREPLPSSKADEVDDWGAAKKSSASSFERRERGGGGGGFFDSQSQNQSSRADESDSWLSKKSFVPSSEPRRMGSFDRERRGGGGGGFDKEMSNGGGADSDVWSKKRGEEVTTENGRPRLVLQPRSLPVSNEEQPQPQPQQPVSAAKSNPFGAARPREEVLAEKGQDWKKIDEQLESVKIKELASPASDGLKKSFGNGRLSSPEDRTEKSWRKTVSFDIPPPSEEKADKDSDGAEEAEN